jgi:hypothetical protein
MTQQRFLHPTDRRRRQRKLYGSRRWEHVRARVLERDGYLCQVKLKRCRVRANTVDHIVRPEEGGAEYDEANLRASCRSCNMVRHNASYFREKVDATARPTARPPALATARAGPAFDPDGIEVQKRLPLVSVAHDHTDYLGIDRHTALFADGAMFRVCPRDCPDRSRLLVVSK